MSYKIHQCEKLIGEIVDFTGVRSLSIDDKEVTLFWWDGNHKHVHYRHGLIVSLKYILLGLKEGNLKPKVSNE
jgi:hypothetical protein